MSEHWMNEDGGELHISTIPGDIVEFKIHCPYNKIDSYFCFSFESYQDLVTKMFERLEEMKFEKESKDRINHIVNNFRERLKGH